MEYNTKREHLQYREYGRNIKKMIDYVCSVEDDEKRKRATRALVGVMGQINGMSLRDEVSLHKLWDHLMVLSSFRLEASWPFTAEELERLKQRVQADPTTHRERLAYKNTHISRRHYGAYLDMMVRKLSHVPDGEEYDTLSTLVAQQAKRSFLVWNGELSDDNIVVNQMEQISGDERLPQRMLNRPIYVNHASLPLEQPQPAKKKKKKK